MERAHSVKVEYTIAAKSSSVRLPEVSSAYPMKVECTTAAIHEAAPGQGARGHEGAVAFSSLSLPLTGSGPRPGARWQSAGPCPPPPLSGLSPRPPLRN